MSNQEEDYSYDVFVSYAEADRTWVRTELLPRLEQSPLQFCSDRDFAPGAPRMEEMERLAEGSRKMLLVLTPAYLESEWGEAINLMAQTLDPSSRRRRLIPVLKEECKLPLRLGHLTYIDFVAPDDPDWAWKQLLTALGAPPEPEPPEPPERATWWLEHPYPMPPNFTGRAAERKMLTKWLDSDTDHPLLVLRALGGFGKSALTWHWLHQDVEQLRWPRVIWWSFYETEATFDSFLAKTLWYLTGGRIDLKSMVPRQMVEALLNLLHQTGILLVLDGFERVLRAYSGMTAAYQGDEPQLEAGGTGTEEVGGTGSRAAAVGVAPERAPSRTLSEDRQRDCVSPLAELFLRYLVSLPGICGKVLMSTRLTPRCLEARGGALLAGCLEKRLTRLRQADAVAFFRAQGIRGSRSEIEQACKPYGYHPLSLCLLAGLISGDLQQPGDITVAKRLDVSGDLIQRQNHVMQQAYDNLEPGRRRLLGRIACFRGPVEYGALNALARYLGDFDDADLRDLLTRGLLHHDRKTNRYDLHPIVRRYAYDRLTGDERSDTHTNLSEYFIDHVKTGKPKTLDDLGPVIELFHHMVQAGQYDEAYRLYLRRIEDRVYYQFGAYDLAIDLLLCVFPDGEEQRPRLADEFHRGQALNMLASCFTLSGQPRRALPMFQRMKALFDEQSEMTNRLVGATNLATAYLLVGELRNAVTALELAIALVLPPEDEWRKAVTHERLGLVHAYRGLWRDSRRGLDRALREFETRGELQAQAALWAFFAWRADLFARVTAEPDSELGQLVEEDEAEMGKFGLRAARRSLELAEKRAQEISPVERDYISAYLRIGAALLREGNADEAEEYLSRALLRCRTTNMVDIEASVLLELAKLRAVLGKRDEALHLAGEALTITERCGYVLQGADVNLFLARMAVDRGDREMALEYAQEARRLATCDGPPDYTYKVAYDEAGVLLADLGYPP